MRAERHRLLPVANFFSMCCDPFLSWQRLHFHDYGANRDSQQFRVAAECGGANLRPIARWQYAPATLGLRDIPSPLSLAAEVFFCATESVLQCGDPSPAIGV